MLEYQKHELKSLTLADIVHPDDLDTGKEKDQKLISGKADSYVMKKQYITKQGNAFDAKITKSAIYNGGRTPEYLIAIIEDITEEKEATDKLTDSLEEKDLLLRELHHRVKNNLAIISGLLELQAFNSSDERVKKLLKDSMMRIKSMALIHESFYQSKKISHVAIENYLEDFVEHIETTLDTSQKNVTINLKSEPVKLNINQAIPLGLLINELVINAYLHAFKEQEKGKIDISVKHNKNQVNIKISDNGKGLPSNFDMDNSSTLGTTIIQTLCKQLDADFSYEFNNGTVFVLSFKNEEKSGSSSAVPAENLI